MVLLTLDPKVLSNSVVFHSVQQLLISCTNSSLALLFNDFLKFLTLHIHRCIIGCLWLGTWCLFLLVVIVHVLLVLVAWEDHAHKRRSGIDSSVRSEPVEQRSDFSLGLDVALSVVHLWHLEAHLHPLDQSITLLLCGWIAQLRKLLLALLIELDSLRDIECVGPEETIDLLLKLGDVLLPEGLLKDLRREDHHGLVEVSVMLLVRKDLRLELHERVDVA